MFNQIQPWRQDVNGGSIVVLRSDTTIQKGKYAQPKDLSLGSTFRDAALDPLPRLKERLTSYRPETSSGSQMFGGKSCLKLDFHILQQSNLQIHADGLVRSPVLAHPTIAASCEAGEPQRTADFLCDPGVILPIHI